MLAQDARLAQRVGAVALIVMIGVIAGFVFLLDRIELGTPVRIRVVFHHVAGLREHAPLVIAGRAIGRIESITPVLRDPLLAGEVGVAVTVAIDGARAADVPAAGELFVASRGALSDRYLEVAPPPGPPGPPVRDGQTVRGVDPPSLDTVLQHTWANMTTYQLFVAAVRPELAALRTEVTRLRGLVADLPGLGATVDATRGLIAEARTTYATPLGGAPGVAALRAMLTDARQTTAQLRAAIELLAPRVTALVANATRIRGQLAASDPLARADRAVTAIRAALARIDPLLASLDELGARIAAGEGSLGRLMSDPEFPEDAKDLGKIMKRQPWKILARPPN